MTIDLKAVEHQEAIKAEYIKLVEKKIIHFTDIETILVETMAYLATMQVKYVARIGSIMGKVNEKKREFNRKKTELARNMNSINTKCPEKCGYGMLRLGIVCKISLEIAF